MAEHNVIKAFINKEDGKYLTVGSTYTSDDAERVSFLAENQYIAAPETKRKTSARKKASAADVKQD